MMLKKMGTAWLPPLMMVLLTGCDVHGVSPPILVSERDSLLDKGKVFIVTNTSDKPLHGIRVEVSSANDAKHSYYQHTVDAHDTFEVGWLELNKWPPPPNSIVDVSVSGYVMAAEYH